MKILVSRVKSLPPPTRRPRRRKARPVLHRLEISQRESRKIMELHMILITEIKSGGRESLALLETRTWPLLSLDRRMNAVTTL
jgi:hypothetical protein